MTTAEAITQVTPARDGLVWVDSCGSFQAAFPLTQILCDRRQERHQTPGFVPGSIPSRGRARRPAWSAAQGVPAVSMASSRIISPTCWTCGRTKQLWVRGIQSLRLKDGCGQC